MARAHKHSPWTLHQGQVFASEDSKRENRRLLEQTGPLALTLDLNASLLDLEQEANVAAVVPLVLPNGDEILFNMRHDNILPESLKRKFPHIKSLSGIATYKGRTVHGQVVFRPESGLRAMIQDGTQLFFIDPIYQSGSTLHKSYASGHKEKRRSGRHLRSTSPCQTEGVPALEEWESSKENEGLPHMEHGIMEKEVKDARQARIQLQEKHILRFAPVANAEYSRFHGNSVPSVLTEIVTLTSRISGILKRELGVALQLHQHVDRLICIECNELKNSNEILDEIKSFVSRQGISRYDVDVGHALTTNPGGVACVGVVCTSHKFCGMTGLKEPFSDAFYVDYVLHELGHQLGATHSFQDCESQSTSTGGEYSSMEPGSGSTIMSYAGICGESNLQTSVDPYYHPYSVMQIETTLARAKARGFCGYVEPVQHVAPEFDFPDECIVPANSYFQLHVNVSDSRNRDLFFTIDAMENLFETKFKDVEETPRFRSWQPTRQTYRTFPDMYYITNQLTDVVMDEKVPHSATTMTFQATVRDMYSRSRVEQQDTSLEEGFGWQYSKTGRVQFVTSFQPLRFLSLSTSIQGTLELVWETGNTERLSPQVELLVADKVNLSPPQERLGDPTSSELQWRAVALLPNTGAARVRVDSMEISLPSSGHLMLRSRSAGELCFFFDVLANIDFPTHVQRGGLDLNQTTSSRHCNWLMLVILFIIIFVMYPQFA